MLTKGCSPSFSEYAFRQSQSPDIKVAPTPVASENTVRRSGGC
jgi:hypothetical protein